MNRNQTVFEYHERTKHHPNRYAASLGYMDWATQPDPFRRYEGSPLLELPLLNGDESPTYGQLYDPSRPSRPLSIESLSRMLQYSMGLAAWKSIGNDRWALRCNASSGNLHPTEATLILPPIEGISDASLIAHYAPKEHALELLATFETDFWHDQPPGLFFVAVSSILWREVWKYGERAFRYTQLDAGHAQHALKIASALNGWSCRRCETARLETVERLSGLDQPQRFVDEETEIADMLLLIAPESVTEPDLRPLVRSLPDTFRGRANRLSHAHHHWEAVELIERAVHTDPSPKHFPEPRLERSVGSDRSAISVILKRRSAQAMDFGRTHIDQTTFRQLLDSIRQPFQPGGNTADLILFIHDVESFEPGLYLNLRDPSHLERLQHLFRKDFLWKEVAEDLYLLEPGDFRAQAKFISCSQDIASDGAFSLGMLSEFRPQVEMYGAHRYKELYWECGAIGQQLYLEATALGLSATGIGCYLDDVMHRLLGLSDNEFQILYHFTIGRAIVDMRLTTLPPYGSDPE